MGTLGTILIGVGVLIATMALLKRRSGAGDVGWWGTVAELEPAVASQASSGTPVAVAGMAVAPETPEGPLVEPISGQACVWWRCPGAAHWQERVRDTSTIDGERHEQLRWEARSRQLASSESGVPFQLTDGSATIWVHPRDVRAEDVSHNALRRDGVPTDGATLQVGPIGFRADEDESLRGYYVDHVCEYIPAGAELLVSGRVRRGPNGTAIGPDSAHGLQLCTAEFAAEQRAIEVAVERAPRVATVAAVALTAAGAIVFMVG